MSPCLQEALGGRTAHFLAVGAIRDLNLVADGSVVMDFITDVTVIPPCASDVT